MKILNIYTSIIEKGNLKIDEKLEKLNELYSVRKKIISESENYSSNSQEMRDLDLRKSMIETMICSQEDEIKRIQQDSFLSKEKIKEYLDLI